jgi:protein-S-isoprenylcysteine O-methyltransferase Ste14
MDDKAILKIQLTVAFWALLILSRLETSRWLEVADTVFAVAIFLLLYWPKRKPGEGFWSKVWSR